MDQFDYVKASLDSPKDDTPTAIEQVGVPVDLWLANFLTPLVVTPTNDGRHWVVDEPFTFESATLEAIIEIPKGFTTDFASVPRVFWPVLSPYGVYSRAAVVHDRCYRAPGIATKHQADRVLLEAMELLGVNLITRQTIYRGVQVFGHWAYKGGL